MKIGAPKIKLLTSIILLVVNSIFISSFLHQTDRKNYELIFSHTPTIGNVSSYSDLMVAQGIIGASYDAGFIFLLSLLKTFFEFDIVYLIFVSVFALLVLHIGYSYNKKYILFISLLYISTQSWIDANILRQALAQLLVLAFIANYRPLLGIVPGLFHKAFFIYTPFIVFKSWKILSIFFGIFFLYLALTYSAVFPDVLGMRKYESESILVLGSVFWIKVIILIFLIWTFKLNDSFAVVYIFSIGLMLFANLMDVNFLRLGNFCSLIECFIIPRIVSKLRDSWLRIFMSLIVLLYIFTKAYSSIVHLYGRGMISF